MDSGPAHCGSKPKRFAIGIAPLGTVSIGIVPMGVVSIGVVAMGVINLSVVGMGLLAVGVNTMGVWTAGPLSMGLVQLNRPEGSPSSHQHHGDHGTAHPAMMAYPSRERAEQEANKLGCEGVHAMGDLWMPCNEHPTSTP